MSEQDLTDRVWYVAYGSNLSLDRFRCYLSGGRPAQSRREYTGCRDPSDPLQAVGLFVPGRLVFAEESAVWGGGMAFYDGGATGLTACRAYVISFEQFADVTAQEMRRPSGGKFAQGLAKLLGDLESARTLGPGLYETVVPLGVLEGAQMLTVTHGDVGSLDPTPPSVAYLSRIAAGLREAHQLGSRHDCGLLGSCSGRRWSVDRGCDSRHRTEDCSESQMPSPKHQS